MATREQTADFIGRRIAVGRVQPGAPYWLAPYPQPYCGPPLPTAHQIAAELIQDAEFRLLRLGGFLNTPGGEFLEQAVEQIIPRALSPEFDLVVAAITLAAALQQGQTRAKAVLMVGGSLLCGAILREMSKAA